MPGDIYSALTGQLPTDQESQQALINALRGKGMMGQIGALSGDPVLAPFGQNLMKSSDQEAENIGQGYRLQAAQKMEQEYKQQQEAHLKQQDLRLQEQSDIARGGLEETRKYHLQEAAKNAAEYGYLIDPKTGMPLTDESGQQHEDPKFRALVNSIKGYNIRPVLSSSSRNPRMYNATVTAMEEAEREGNPYDVTAFERKEKTMRGFSADGAEGRLLTSANKVVNHLTDVVLPSIDELHNSPITFLNHGANLLKTTFGLSAAPTNLDAISHIVSAEVNKFIDGGGTGAGALADRKALQEDLDKAKSPELLKGVIHKWSKLMAGQIEGLRVGYEADTKRTDFNDKLSEGTKRYMGIPITGPHSVSERYKGFSSVELPPDQSATPDNPQGQAGRPPAPPPQPSDFAPAG